MAIGSFSAGLSGLTANAEALKVVGNNLANLNTVGYKASSVAFEELVSQGGGSASARGLGVAVSSIAPIFSQGSIESSREATNVAIQGNGMFVVKGPQGNVYTRAGNFTFNNNGELVTPDGYKVQGYTAVDPLTGEVLASGEPTDIAVPPGVLRAPTPTSVMTMASNLDADAKVGDTLDASMQVYDSLGAAHVLSVTYTNTAPGQWSYSMSLPGTEVTPASAAPVVVSSGTLAFNSVGVLQSIVPDTGSTGGGSATPGPIASMCAGAAIPPRASFPAPTAGLAPPWLPTDARSPSSRMARCARRRSTEAPRSLLPLTICAASPGRMPRR